LKGGGFQGFDEGIDAGKIRDGDVYAYAGEKAKERAFAFRDMYNIEVCSIRELRQKVQDYFDKSYSLIMVHWWIMPTRNYPQVILTIT
jgi:hypothetical protein